MVSKFQESESELVPALGPRHFVTLPRHFDPPPRQDDALGLVQQACQTMAAILRGGAGKWSLDTGYGLAYGRIAAMRTNGQMARLSRRPKPPQIENLTLPRLARTLLSCYLNPCLFGTYNMASVLLLYNMTH